MSVLEAKDVSIRYLTGDFKEIGLKEYVMRKLQGNYHVQEFWADRDITFSLEKGDMLGIIGVNGSGKSTLLKAISGIMEPSRGHVRREGNVAALLELASGFDGELTVRENTYLRGAMLGYTRGFMDEKYDEIIDFAELRDFQDRPFRQLSSGMQSRLAFSIASLVQPDLLILDEVLSVGDGAFQQKSAAKMWEIIQGGATTILVSHSLDQVEELCNKVLWLHKGEQIAFGDTEELCGLYRRFLSGEITVEEVKALPPGQTMQQARAEKKPEQEKISADTPAQMPSTQKTPGDLVRTIALFLFSFVLLELYIAGIDPTGSSGDANNIWQAIVGIAKGTPVGSYVMYKGFMSCYPYVWFYQLSMLLGLPEFFFVKLYHGVLFAYITAIGVPCVIGHLFQRKPKACQVLCFSVAAFILWRPTAALDQLMVDLPCCAFFFFAIHMAIRLGQPHRGYAAAALLAGLFCGLNSTVSGQYSLAMLCVLLFAALQILVRKEQPFSWKRKLFYVLVLLAAYAVPYTLNEIFMAEIVDPLIANGAWIPAGEAWMRRGLLAMLPLVENLPARVNLRAYAILEGIYGSTEAADAAWAAARAGGAGWTVQEWFAAFFRYPLDFLLLLLDKAFLCVTTDALAMNLCYLLVGYTLLYIALLGMVKHTLNIRSVFQRKALLIIATLLTILPAVVLTVEARYAISLQGLIFGTALMGPVLGDGGRAVIRTAQKLTRSETRLGDASEHLFPWEVMIGVFFVWVCLTHYGDLMAHTYSGLELLFTK